MKSLHVLAAMIACCTIAIAKPAPGTAPAPDAEVHTLKIRASAPHVPMRHHLLPPVSEIQSGDAAPLYLNAALLGGDRRDAIDKYLNLPVAVLASNDDAAVLVRSSDMVFLDEAARQDQCRWQAPVRSQGMNALMPYLTPMHMSGLALALRARLAISQNDFDGAVDSLQSGFALVQHLERQPLLVQSLVATAVGSSLLDQVETLIQEPGAPNLYWSLWELPHPLVDRRETARQEAATFDAAFPRLRESRNRRLSPDEWQELLEQMNNIQQQQPVDLPSKIGIALLSARDYPAAKRFLIKQGQTAEAIDALPVQQALVTYYTQQFQIWADDILRSFSLPYPMGLEHERKTRRERSREIEASSNPLKIFAASLDRAAATIVRVDRRVAILQIAESIRAYAAANGGQLPPSLDALGDLPALPDPATGKPFDYTATANTAVITGPAPEGEWAARSLRYEITLIP